MTLLCVRGLLSPMTDELMGGTRTVDTLLPSKAEALTREASVLRALPRREMRRIGPFVFCDHFGPAPAAPSSMDVPPHPHVGLQTVTYLFSGAVRHRDSLGSEQIIRPGDCNWMTAGRGIVHSERTLAEGESLHGIQTWVGLPQAHRGVEPAFQHFPASSLPVHRASGAEVRVVAGTLGALRSPVPTFQAITYLDVALAPGAEIELDVDPTHQLAVYVAVGALAVEGTEVARGVIARLVDGAPRLRLRAPQGARAIVLGGEPLPEPTVIHWNFVVDSQAEGKERFSDWEAGRFPKMPFAD